MAAPKIPKRAREAGCAGDSRMVAIAFPADSGMIADDATGGARYLRPLNRVFNTLLMLWLWKLEKE